MTLLFTVKTEEIKMNEFENARKEIEIIDRQLVELFERRMEMAAVIGEYKSENGLPVRDHDREQTLTERNLSFIKNNDIKPYYAEFLGKIIDLSCEYQQKIINGRRAEK